MEKFLPKSKYWQKKPYFDQKPFLTITENFDQSPILAKNTRNFDKLFHNKIELFKFINFYSVLVEVTIFDNI